MPDIVLVPPGSAVPMDPASSAFAHGFGLFETMRYDSGSLYFWGDHWARLSHSAQYFGLALPEQAAVLRALRQFVHEHVLEAATLKLSLLKESNGSRLYIYTRPPLPAPAGCRLRLEVNFPVVARSYLAGHKTHNYMEAMHLLNSARSEGFYDVLRLDEDGHLAESAVSNLFFIKDGRLHTPALSTGILPGVTRAALLRSPDLAVVEGRFPPDALLGAEVAFLTNATAGIQPVEQILGFPSGEVAAYPLESAALVNIQAAYGQAASDSARQLI